MKLGDFRKQVVEPLKGHCSTFNEFRVQSIYEDLQNTYALVQEFQAEANKQDVFEGAKPDDEAAVYEALETLSRLLTLFRALFIFADLFVSMLLSETVGKPGLTLNKFLDKPNPPLLKLSTNEVLPAYCIVIYRNKIIAHHDVKRKYGGAKFSHKMKHLVLVPLPEQFHIAKEDVAALLRLKSKYEASLPDLVAESNQFALLKTLFYGIPIGSLGAINADRKEINAIAERGGCESLPPNEVVDALDQFAMTMVRAL